MKIFRKYILPLLLLSVSILAFPNGQREADALVSKARISVNKRNYSVAIPLLNEAKKIYEKLGETIIVEYADNLYLLGICNAETNPEQAAHYAKLASDLIQRLEGKQNMRYAKTVALYGDCRYAMGEYEEALDLHKDALSVFKVIESDTRKVSRAYELCGDDYIALEDCNNALKQWEIALRLSEKFSTAYDRLLDKSISALQKNGKSNKQLRKFLDLKRDSDIENGRIEEVVVAPASVEPKKEESENAGKQEVVLQKDKEDKVSEEQEKAKKPKNKRSRRNSQRNGSSKKESPEEIRYFNY